MPTMTSRDSILTVVTLANALSGKLGEFIPFNAVVQVAAVADKNLVTMRCLIGSEVQVDNQELDDDGATPKFPDHEIVEFTALQGDRLIIGYTNNNAATTIVRLKVRITPIR